MKNVNLAIVSALVVLARADMIVENAYQYLATWHIYLLHDSQGAQEIDNTYEQNALDCYL